MHLKDDARSEPKPEQPLSGGKTFMGDCGKGHEIQVEEYLGADVCPKLDFRTSPPDKRDVKLAAEPRVVLENVLLHKGQEADHKRQQQVEQGL